MKKLVYLGALALTTCLFTASCEKEVNPDSNLNSKNVQNEQEISNKNNVNNITKLVEKFKGKDINSVGNILEELISSDVLKTVTFQALVSNKTFSNNFVEMVYLSKAPVSDQDMDVLIENRPNFHFETINNAQEHVESKYDFSVVNGETINIVFGEDLIIEKVCDKQCSSKISSKSKDNPTLLIYQLGNNGNDDIFPARSCKETNGVGRKWICGDPKRQEYCGSDGTVICVTTLCENSTERCVRRVQRRIK